MPSGIYKHKSLSEKHKASISNANKGKKRTEDEKKRMSLAHIGQFSGEKNPMFGKKNPNATGEKNNSWKGGIYSDKEYVSWSKNGRNRMKKSNGGQHTFGEWELLKAQYNWTCPCCKRAEPEIKLTEDHIIPVSKGGSDNIVNIQPLCAKCNLKKFTKTIKY